MKLNAILRHLRRCVGASIVVALLLFPLVVSATGAQSSQVPVEGSFGCQLCHVDPAPTSFDGAEVDTFGAQAAEHLTGTGDVTDQTIDWQALCPLDADGDGFTNGQELGDPDCLFPDVTSTSDPSDPGDPDSVPPSDGMSDVGDAGADVSDGADASGGDDASDAAEGRSNQAEGGCSTSPKSPHSVPPIWSVIFVGIFLIVRRSRTDWRGACEN